jgi:hypothetical protein
MYALPGFRVHTRIQWFCVIIEGYQPRHSHHRQRPTPPTVPQSTRSPHADSRLPACPDEISQAVRNRFPVNGAGVERLLKLHHNGLVKMAGKGI